MLVSSRMNHIWLKCHYEDILTTMVELIRGRQQVQLKSDLPHKSNGII